jgi:hypothetical protein
MIMVRERSMECVKQKMISMVPQLETEGRGPSFNIERIQYQYMGKKERMWAFEAYLTWKAQDVTAVPAVPGLVVLFHVDVDKTFLKKPVLTFLSAFQKKRKPTSTQRPFVSSTNFI